MINVSQERGDSARAQLLDGPRSFAPAWSARRVVVAAPDVDDVSRRPILDALAPDGEDLLCLTTEGAGASYPHQSVILAPAEVDDWRRRFLVTAVVIARTDLSAAALETVDEFMLIGGDRDTVEKALGQTVEDARAEFVAYADSMARAARHLPGVAAQYS